MISQYIINPDQEIEIVYTCLKYNYYTIEEDPEPENNPAEFTLNIINESGQKLLTVPNSYEMKLASANGKNKLLIFKNIGKSFREDSEILVYSLPEELNCCSLNH